MEVALPYGQGSTGHPSQSALWMQSSCGAVRDLAELNRRDADLHQRSEGSVICRSMRLAQGFGFESEKS